MSNNLDITENHLRILSLFAKGYDREYYIREICRHVPVSHGTAWNVLSSLEEKGVTTSGMKGRTRIFRLKKTVNAQNYMLLSESYRRLRFSEKYPLVDEIIYKILPEFNGPLALFGSYSSGEATENSDIDLFTAGSYNKNEIRKASGKFGIEINVKQYEKELFKEAGLKDHLIREIYNNHVFLKCPEFFVSEVMMN